MFLKNGGRFWIGILAVLLCSNVIASDCGDAECALERKSIAVWEVADGALLCDTMRSWADIAGWQTVCDLGQDDYRLGASGSYFGVFREAVKKMIDSLPNDVRVKVHLYGGNNPPLIHVLHDNGVSQ